MRRHPPAQASAAACSGIGPIVGVDLPGVAMCEVGPAVTGLCEVDPAVTGFVEGKEFTPDLLPSTRPVVF